MDIYKIYKEIRIIASKYNDIKKVVLFGSRARGDNDRTSDIDIAVFPKTEPFKNETRFWLDLEDLDTLLQFDLVIVNEDIDEELKKNINREGVILYE